MTSLPQPFDVTREWTWEQYQPHYEKLAEADLTPETVDGWLADWTAIQSTLFEAGTWLRIHNHLDTNTTGDRFWLQ